FQGSNFYLPIIFRRIPKRNTDIPCPVALLALETALRHRFPKPPLFTRLLSTSLTPALISCIKCTGFAAEISVSGETTLVQKLAKKVLGVAVFLGGNPYLLRGQQSVALPHQAAADRPCQDTGKLATEFLRQALVLIVIRDGHREGDQPNPSPNGV